MGYWLLTAIYFKFNELQLKVDQLTYSHKQQLGGIKNLPEQPGDSFNP
ncbi:hypothetical protein [Ferruginibacter albus]|nr:hypothetical protein [Ferruginibacter albus]UAY51137.1 hypothetical protein K9M53_11110 [Ferruginibacter albus]